MKPLQVVVSMAVHEATLARLRDRLPTGSDIKFLPWTHRSEPAPAEILREAEVLLCEYPPSNFADCARLRWIQLNSVGFSQLYGLGLPQRGIRATNARGVFDVPIAEWCVAMMVNLARDVPGMLRNQQQRLWDPGARFQGELRGSVLGLYGYGGIGRETARLAKALGLEVWVLARSPIGARERTYVVPGTGDPQGRLPDRIFSPERKEEFFRGVDYLVLAMPLTPQTRGIVGAAELALLRPPAAILNPARGPLIEEQPLIAALRERRIRAAALDTHYRYPLPPEHALWGMENVILTPHISGSSENPRFLERIWDIFSRNMDLYLRDEPLLNEVDAHELAAE
jgi:phosphoglycerate dehydrogenase-like enzyme